MTHDARCSSCQATIGPPNIDQQRELATCTRCGRLTDLRRAPALPPKQLETRPQRALVHLSGYPKA